MKTIQDKKDLKRITLNGNQVHIWHSDLDKLNKNKNLLSPLLSQDERNRAERFHFEKDSDRFICGRGLLRILLHFYSRIPIKLIHIEYNEYGKPHLSEKKVSDSLQFNVSHSENRISFAFTKFAKIGIDIEFLKPIPNFIELAERYFSAAEFQQLISLPDDKKIEGFYNCWTRKEATIKAIGEGLSFPLKDFDVSIIPGDKAKILTIYRRAKDLKEKIHLHSFNPEPNLVCAVTVLGSVSDVDHFKVDDLPGFFLS